MKWHPPLKVIKSDKITNYKYYRLAYGSNKYSKLNLNIVLLIVYFQSIFGPDLQDLRKPSAWNSWVPLEICITLLPQQGNSGLQEDPAKIDLQVKCSPQYPDV